MLHVSLEFLDNAGKLGEGKSWTLVGLQKELSYCKNKGFSSNKMRQVSSCCAVGALCSQGKATHAANAPSSLQSKDRTANRFRPMFPTRAVVQTCPSFLSLPGEWKAVKYKDAALERWSFPCLSFLQKNRFIECNKCVDKTILLGTMHLLLPAKLSAINTLNLLCCVMPAPTVEKSVP